MPMEPSNFPLLFTLCLCPQAQVHSCLLLSSPLTQFFLSKLQVGGIWVNSPAGWGCERWLSPEASTKHLKVFWLASYDLKGMRKQVFVSTQDELMTVGKTTANQKSVKETHSIFPVHCQPT